MDLLFNFQNQNKSNFIGSASAFNRFKLRGKLERGVTKYFLEIKTVDQNQVNNVQTAGGRLPLRDSRCESLR